MSMTVTINGEELDFQDDIGIRSHSASRAINMLKTVRPASLGGKKRSHTEELRLLFIGLYTNLHFVTIKAGGLLAFHQLNGDKTMPVSEFAEVMAVLRKIVGEDTPRTTTRQETTDANNPGAGATDPTDAAGAAGGAAGAEPAEAAAVGPDATAASALDAH